ncbi:hypothetical protein F0562_018132 [Nyssa sinensis]|uniref:RING-CH-type domain-containing protein n=1 Tax=Nyssa sinensis TaxID=561372 RepID=A0A5J4ZCV1_9ASTE|nr:hypothetical protein F0562_018132 [Nyssa sinensis]
MDHAKSDKEGISETLNSENSINSVHQGTIENSNNSIDGVVSETLVVIRSDEEDVACVSGENGDLNAKVNVSGSSKVLVDEQKIKESKDEKHSCVIDVKCSGGGFGENLDGERVCRICHLTSDQSSETNTTTTTTTTNLIQLGCGCKDELGIAHSHCAEAWFKLKGNRLCEICGKTAKNITGVEDNRFMEEWNDQRSSGSGTNASNRGGGCWRGQPFCNFLMACLVIAFVLPWFFRVNMF